MTDYEFQRVLEREFSPKERSAIHPTRLLDTLKEIYRLHLAEEANKGRVSQHSPDTEVENVVLAIARTRTGPLDPTSETGYRELCRLMRYSTEEPVLILPHPEFGARLPHAVTR